MPITPGSFIPSSGAPSSGANPFAGMSAPSFQFQGVNPQITQAISGATAGAPPGMGQGYSAINSLLTQQPQSVTNTVMPYMQQLYGMSAQGTLPFLQNQAAQGVADTESEMGQRGLVGSSIEQAGIIGSQQAGQQSINSYVGNMAQSLAQNYMQSVGVDIGSNNQMYQDLAQALGQELGNTETYNLGQQEIASANQNAQTMANASRYGATRSMWGSIIGGAFSGLGNAFGHSDENSKKNIESLKPVSFEYKKGYGVNGKGSDTKGKLEGFTAQNVKKVYPDSVAQGQDGMKINMMSFMAHIVQQLKEHHEDIQHIKAVMPALSRGAAARG